MKHEAAREIGETLKPFLEHLKALAKDERAKNAPDAEAIEVATINLNSAIDILTE